MWFLAQLETSERATKALTDQIYNQPINWFICCGLIGSLAFIGLLLTRTFRQADKTAEEKKELQEIVLKMNRESVEALTQIKAVVSDLRALMSADVEATRLLAEKISEQNGEIKTIAREITTRRRTP